METRLKNPLDRLPPFGYLAPSGRPLPVPEGLCMSKSQALGSLFFTIFLYSFPWVTHAQEPDNRPPTVPYRDLSFTGNHGVKHKTLKALVKAYKCGDGYDLRDTDADI